MLADLRPLDGVVRRVAGERPVGDQHPGVPWNVADDGVSNGIGEPLSPETRVPKRRPGVDLGTLGCRRPPLRGTVERMAIRPATVADLRELAGSMPGVKVEGGPLGNVVYQVSRRSFVFFRNPRPDAVDPDTGERYDDVVVLWVGSESDKEALVADPSTPFFSTPHFDGHPSVLLRASRIGELDRGELAEIVYDAWLARASKTAARRWLEARGES